MFDERVQRFREARRSGRCPDELRGLAVGYAWERGGEGVGLAAVDREPGTSPTSLRLWMRQAEVEFRPMEVVGPSHRGTPRREGALLTVVTPKGYRLEGLDLGEAARLLAVLG